ncbi:MAG: cupin domain-containing protein [Terriglobia bacterium]
MTHSNWNEIEIEEMNSLLGRQMVVGQNLMVCRLHLKKGCVVPLHQHVHEQMSLLEEGKLRWWLGDQEFVAEPHGVVSIPSGMPHKVEALEDSIALDVFNPPREDFLSKSDAYLRR